MNNRQDLPSDDEAEAEAEQTQNGEEAEEALSGDEGADLSDADIFFLGVED